MYLRSAPRNKVHAVCKIQRNQCGEILGWEGYATLIWRHITGDEVAVLFVPQPPSAAPNMKRILKELFDCLCHNLFVSAFFILFCFACNVFKMQGCFSMTMFCTVFHNKKWKNTRKRAWTFFELFLFFFKFLVKQQTRKEKQKNNKKQQN